MGNCPTALPVTESVTVVPFSVTPCKAYFGAARNARTQDAMRDTG